MIQRGKQGNFGERGAISLSMLVLDFLKKILLLVFYFSLKIILLFLTIRFLYLFFFFRMEDDLIKMNRSHFLRSKFWYEGSHWWGRLLFLSSETCYLESIVHAGWIKKENLQNFLFERKFHIFLYRLDTFRVEQWFRWFLFAPFNIFLEFLENL